MRVVYISEDLHTWTASTREAEHLAEDVTQVDADGIRRAYRRASLDWLTYLYDRAVKNPILQPRFTAVHLLAYGLSDAPPARVLAKHLCPPGYRPPRVAPPLISPTVVAQ